MVKITAQFKNQKRCGEVVDWMVERVSQFQKYTRRWEMVNSKREWSNFKVCERSW